MLKNHLKRIIFIPLILLGTFIQLLSQPHPDTDSLFTIIRAEKNDSIKVRLYHKIAWNNHFSDIELSLACTDTALVISEKLNNNFFIGKCYHYYGLYHRLTADADSAIINFEKALQIWGTDVDSFALSGTIFNLGVMNDLAGNYETALNYYVDYKRINLKEDNQRGVCEADNSIGLVFKRNKDYDKAISYLKSSLVCAEAIDDIYQQGLSLANLQSIYIELDSFQLSIDYGKLSLVQQEKLNELSTTGMIYDNLGVAYLFIDQLDSAEIYAQKAIESLDIQGQKIHLAEAYATMGSIRSKLNDPANAIDYFDKALAITKTGNYKPIEIRIYKGLSEAHKQLNNFRKSNEYLNKYVTISDSLFNAEKFEIISDLEVKYETAEKEIQLKAQELEIQEKTNRNKIFTFSSILLGLLAASIFFLMRNRLISSKKISAQRDELNVQKIEKLEKEKKILTMDALIEGQEVERKRIAQDLHDGLGGLLATVKTKFGIIQNQIEELESMNVYQEANTLLDNACTEVRKIAHNMMPESLTKLGLLDAVKDIATQYNEMKVEVINLGLHDLSETKEVMLYRVIQEFLNNTRKHAIASEVIIQFSQDDGKQLIYLEDNGGGFDIFKLPKNKGMGLKSMESRINYINGTMKLESAEGVGTTVTITVPA